MLEMLALITGIMTGVIIIAEKIAFCIMLWMLCAWVIQALDPVVRWLNRHFGFLFAGIRALRDAIQFWWMTRTLRRQFPLAA